MNSKQINFFLTVPDQERLEAAIRSREEFKALGSSANKGELRPVDSTSLQVLSDGLKIFLVHPDHLALVRLTELNLIDVVQSPVVEFVRCYQTPQLLRRGRFYAVTAFYEGNVLVKKPEDFLRWTNSIFALARKALLKDPDSFFYYGAEAMACKQSGQLLFEEL